jgi:hypothetical protein
MSLTIRYCLLRGGRNAQLLVVYRTGTGYERWSLIATFLARLGFDRPVAIPKRDHLRCANVVAQLRGGGNRRDREHQQRVVVAAADCTAGRGPYRPWLSTGRTTLDALIPFLSRPDCSTFLGVSKAPQRVGGRPLADLSATALFSRIIPLTPALGSEL